MRILTAQQIRNVLDYPSLIDATGNSFKGSVEHPVRADYLIKRPNGLDATLMVMPAWSDAGYLG
ncbi:MAG: hypothetical protein E2O84_04985 [Bacteroidetes bacterium]|nr:MAG: hypothetical protein E2O84_04985 [Bacteroidota bacterium]